jgi:hypothetical protein
MRSWLLLLGAAICSVSGAATKQSSRDLTLAAIEAGVTRNERPDVLGVAPAGWVTGADCVEKPCWVAVHADTPLDIKGESTEPALASKKSNNILKRCSGPIARKEPTLKHLIADSILFWLWAVDPAAYFFVYVKGDKLQALPTPARPVSPRVPVQDTEWASGERKDADRLPAGVQRRDLLIVFRQNGLRLLCGRVAHKLADAEAGDGISRQAGGTDTAPTWSRAASLALARRPHRCSTRPPLIGKVAPLSIRNPIESFSVS